MISYIILYGLLCISIIFKTVYPIIIGMILVVCRLSFILFEKHNSNRFLLFITFLFNEISLFLSVIGIGLYINNNYSSFQLPMLCMMLFCYNTFIFYNLLSKKNSTNFS